LFDFEFPVIDIEFVLRWEYTNQYRGKGMFLRTIWTEVNTCNVLDGFDVDISFACSNPGNDNPSGSPPWPAALINIDMTSHITTPKWQKQNDKWKVLVKYNGALEMR
jgi:hypothetical protein